MNVRLVTKIDNAKLQQFIKDNATTITTPAVNANLAINDGKPVIVPEAFGAGSVVKNADQVIPENIAGFNEQPLTLTPIKLSPDILAKDLEPSQAKLTQLLGQSIKFVLGQKTITVSPAEIAGWIELTPVIEDKTVDIAVNSGKVEQYIEQLAENHREPPRSRVIMDAPTGEIVLDGGSGGVDITQKEATATIVAQYAQKGTGYTAELPINYQGAKTVHVPFADKVLVVDITTKRMYAYEKSTLVKTILVSAGAPRTPTAIGQFAIFSKYVSQDMRGGNADGSRYFQPDVPYVNYFYGAMAIHGNYWRGNSYFGNINSSHGCVGINVADGAWVYDWAPIGTPVIVHN